MFLYGIILFGCVPAGPPGIEEAEAGLPLIGVQVSLVVRI